MLVRRRGYYAFTGMKKSIIVTFADSGFCVALIGFGLNNQSEMSMQNLFKFWLTFIDGFALLDFN